MAMPERVSFWMVDTQRVCSHNSAEQQTNSDGGARHTEGGCDYGESYAHENGQLITIAGIRSDWLSWVYKQRDADSSRSIACCGRYTDNSCAQCIRPQLAAHNRAPEEYKQRKTGRHSNEQQQQTTIRLHRREQ